MPNGITIDRFWRTIFGSWGWGGSLFARGVLASDRPVLDDFRPVFRFVLVPPPLLSPVLTLQPDASSLLGVCRVRHSLRAKGPRLGTPAPVGRSRLTPRPSPPLALPAGYRPPAPSCRVQRLDSITLAMLLWLLPWSRRDRRRRPG